jgi:hypothetical protein
MSRRKCLWEAMLNHHPLEALVSGALEQISARQRVARIKREGAAVLRLLAMAAPGAEGTPFVAPADGP